MKADPKIEALLKKCADADTFWRLLADVVPTNAKAYLGTHLKQAEILLNKGLLNPVDERLEQWRATASNIDVQKLFTTFAPHVHGIENWREFMKILNVEAPESLYLKHLTPETYYLLFQVLKQCDDTQKIRQICVRLLTEGSDKSYNFVALAQRYFQLENFPARFSLKIEDYEIGRVDESYEKFRKLLS